jgi:ribosome-associated toxin RatA of RatAB toxin-antitoxin module
MAAFAAVLAHASAFAQDVTFRTARDGDFVTVAASAVMKVDPRVAWAVLTDYDHLAKFIPDMKSSRVLSREGNKVRVEQKGDIGFFFYKEPVNVTLEVVEEPPNRITSRSVEGNIRALESHYTLQAAGEAVKLDYSGRFEPDFTIPPLIGMPIVSHMIERRFRAMVDEIQRRDALARRAAKQETK